MQKKRALLSFKPNKYFKYAYNAQNEYQLHIRGPLNCLVPLNKCQENCLYWVPVIGTEQEQHSTQCEYS